MPNRILKDSICTSPNIDALSRDAECFFYRLLVQCDDFGRMDARPAILRAKCYPLQVDTVTTDAIKAWLSELVRADLVALYTVEQQPYLQMRTWERHQQIRAKRSKYPDMQSSDINCNQVIANVPVIQSNPIQSESEIESESESIITPDGAPTKPAKHPVSLQQEMFGAVADTCELDAKLKASVIGKTSKQLLDAGYTPEQVRGFKLWWQSDNWRSEHTPVPSIHKLTEMLPQFRNGRPVLNGNGHTGNGRMSPLDRSLQSIEEVREMLRNGGTI